MEQRFCGQHDETAEPDGDAEGKDQALPYTEMNPIPFSGTEVLPDEAGNGCTEGIADCPEDAVDLRGHRPGGNYYGTERVNADLNDHVGDGVHGTLQSGRKSKAKHVAEINTSEFQLTEAQTIGLGGTHQLSREECHVDNLSDDSRDSDTGNLPVKENHKQDVKDNVGDTANHHIKERTEGIAY